MIEERFYLLIEDSRIKKRKKKELLKIGKKILKTSSQMIDSAASTGMTSKETIELSVQVDQLINQFHRKRNMYIYFKE
ncbi:aspartyl-phosphate phosphatase Spo0E family protein [Metabacillus litoralis]|uniref:aspartyl-phosphate phosphatase Spo0E family protein n=1 Tax=Metabacillus litoralis TaxID=152268 RepID=UPI001CFCCD33|nr:aspartyl-phosphate phosphatase Spo0E family protein [Metabacillus litoralis]